MKDGEEDGDDDGHDDENDDENQNQSFCLFLYVLKQTCDEQTNNYM